VTTIDANQTPRPNLIRSLSAFRESYILLLKRMHRRGRITGNPELSRAGIRLSSSQAGETSGWPTIRPQPVSEHVGLIEENGLGSKSMFGY
jgi:hypothetical protein